MTLLTAHKILIASAIVVFAWHAVVDLGNYTRGEEAALPLSLLSAATAGALGIYLRWVWVRGPYLRSK